MIILIIIKTSSSIQVFSIVFFFFSFFKKGCQTQLLTGAKKLKLGKKLQSNVDLKKKKIFP